MSTVPACVVRASSLTFPGFVAARMRPRTTETNSRAMVVRKRMG